MPTGHSDLWAPENLTSWSLEAHARWTRWSLGYLKCDFMISSETCQLDTMISGLLRMWPHDLFRNTPTRHCDLRASENVASWSLQKHANWTQWSLGYLKCDFMISSETCQLDTMISGLLKMWLHDLFRNMPTGHNDLWASENATSWSLQAHANWTQWCENVTSWSLQAHANWTQWSLGQWECDFVMS